MGANVKGTAAPDPDRVTNGDEELGHTGKEVASIRAMGNNNEILFGIIPADFPERVRPGVFRFSHLELSEV
ncbi:MAG: hypothetical protein HQL75_14680 [Magnetococcales bacterium]|nr:hypothetical protein [Magnetococcales bacterium]